MFLAVVGKIGGVTSDTCTSDLFILLTIILLTPDWAKVLISGDCSMEGGGPEGTSSWSSFGSPGLHSERNQLPGNKSPEFQRETRLVTGGKNFSELEDE